MQTKYFKIVGESFGLPYYLKLSGDDKDCSELNLFKGSIDFNHSTGDSITERLNFNYGVVREDEQMVEIDRQEFDEFYKGLVDVLNQITVL